MKKIILFFIALMLINTGCNNPTKEIESLCETEEFSPIPPYSNAFSKEQKIIGSWEWIKTTQGGWILPPIIVTPESSDSSNYYIFSSDSVFKEYPDGCLNTEGTFNFYNIGLPSDSTIGVKIYYDAYDVAFWFNVIEAEPDTLVLSQAAWDGPEYLFIRVTGE